MLFSVITQKVLAILIGAEGIAQVGNLKNVFSFFEQFSILGTSNGLVKYVSEFRDDKLRLNDLFSTSTLFVIAASVLSFIILFFWSNSLSVIVFSGDTSYDYIFKVLAFMIPFMGINSILNALLNGISEYKLYSKVTFITIVLSTILIVFFTYVYGLIGAMLAIVLTPIIQFIMGCFFLSDTFKRYIGLGKFSFSLSFKNELLSYSVMSVVVILSINVADLAVRNLIEQNTNITNAGYWTALASISKTYMQFTATIFPLYVLPKYSKITTTFEFRNEVINIYKLLLPLVMIGMILIYLFRDVVVKILFTSDFLQMTNLFKWQLLGDLVKFIALVISYQFLAKRQIGYFVFTELLSVLLFYTFSVLLIETYGTEGIVMAHFFRYVVYFFVVLYILRFNFIGQDKSI